MKWIIRIIIVLALVMGLLTILGNRSKVMDTQSFSTGANNMPKALVVYHPGLSNFPHQVAYAVVEGLMNNDWSVQVETAHDDTSTPDDFDLLVVVGPTYWWTPALPLRRYIKGLASLQGQKCMAVVTAMGHGRKSLKNLSGWLEEKGGEVVGANYYYTMAPNDDENYTPSGNKEVGIEMAQKAAEKVAQSW